MLATWTGADPFHSAADHISASRAVAPFPNLFDTWTTLRLGLPKASALRMAVYDVLGRDVTVLVNGPRGAGMHEVQFDGLSVVAGLYIARLDAAGHSDVCRITLTRGSV